jgi:hypothetical protein
MKTVRLMIWRSRIKRNFIRANTSPFKIVTPSLNEGLSNTIWTNFWQVLSLDASGHTSFRRCIASFGSFSHDYMNQSLNRSTINVRMFVFLGAFILYMTQFDTLTKGMSGANSPPDPFTFQFFVPICNLV